VNEDEFLIFLASVLPADEAQALLGREVEP